ncbi:MAG: cation:dicarboxylase symporter family transporter [Candidatus Krumholzibacteria bacterium]|nr:cation:dicarboxylase symporter family transporter [Candidatus Krumholzibacteria bacterium]
MKKFPKRFDLASLTALGLLGGIVCGLFFGEHVGFLAKVGEVYIGLLQMTVLPYISVALIANIGGMPHGKNRRLVSAVIGFLTLSWFIAMLAIVLLPFTLPPLKSASFFSFTTLEPVANVNFLKLFIPANPFFSLANNHIPAVVLFCVFLGAAINTMQNREGLVDAFEIMTDVLERVNRFLMQLTPLGIFSIAASTAGTIELVEFERLQAYILLYSVAAGLIGFVVFPGLIVGLTPFKYGEVFRAVRIPLMTAFVTGKVFIVLPMLIEQTRQMFSNKEVVRPTDKNIIRMVILLIYPFPHAGKLLALLFLPFAAWFGGEPMAFVQYPLLLLAGSLSFFGSPLVAMPFLLDLQKLPADMFQLFILSGIYCERVGDALGAVHLLFVAVMTAAVMRGLLRVRLVRVLSFLALTLGIWATVLFCVHIFFDDTLNVAYTKDNLALGMHAAVSTESSIVLNEKPSLDLERKRLPVIKRIERYGALRVGYYSNNLPHSFINSGGDLVGLDMDLARRLAAGLNCRLEFVLADSAKYHKELGDGTYDILMGGTMVLPQAPRSVIFSNSYMVATGAVIVEDHRRGEMGRQMHLRDFDNFKIGIIHHSSRQRLFEHHFSGATKVPIDSPLDYLSGGHDDLDGWIWSAEAGAFWTLLYPDFSVVPLEPLVQIPMSYPVASNQLEFLCVVNTWLDVMDATGEFGRLYDYWILGETKKIQESRWSLIKDVLHWVE